MSRLRTLLAVPLFAGCAFAAGCGSASTQVASAPPKVQVSLTAPTDGATVDVPRIYVIGTIVPRNARLRVAGKAVRVVDGTFREPMSLRRGLTHIRIDATARGFARSGMVVAVRYRARISAPETSSSKSPVPNAALSDGGGLPQGSLAEAVNSCSNETGGNMSVCVCVFQRLARAGFNTRAQWEALVKGWRRSFLSNGVIAYPPVMKNAIVACVRQFRGQ